MKAENLKQDHAGYTSNEHVPLGLQMPTTTSLTFCGGKKETKVLKFYFKQQHFAMTITSL